MKMTQVVIVIIGGLIGIIITIRAWAQIKNPRTVMLQTKCISGIFYWLGKYQLCDGCGRPLFQDDRKTAWLIKKVAVVSLFLLPFKKNFELERFCYCLDCAPTDRDALERFMREENGFEVKAK